MNENENQEVLTEQTAADYVDTVAQLKSTYEAKVNKLAAENKELFNKLVNNVPQEVSQDAVKPDLTETLDGIRNYKKSSDMELAEHMVNLYDQLGYQAFMPNDKNYIPTQQDYVEIDNFINGLKSCLDNCEGNPQEFSSSFSKLIVYRK